jgi:hypothetical protein
VVGTCFVVDKEGMLGSSSSSLVLKGKGLVTLVAKRLKRFIPWTI